MPRKDRMTGCEVVTTREYFQAEAEESGREWYELMGDMFDEIDKDFQLCGQSMIKSGEAEEKLIEASVEEYDALEWNWFIISTNIHEVHIDTGLGWTGHEIKASAYCSDGQYREVVFRDSESYGTYWEPPDYDRSWIIDGEKFG